MKNVVRIIFISLLLVGCSNKTEYKGSIFDTQSNKTITRAKYNQMKQEPKVALVIGNRDYEIDALRYPIDDARKIRNFLEGKGFTVIYAENIETKGKLRELINRFISSIRQNGIGLFYFSGHGMNAYNKNHLIPIRNSSIHDDRDIEDIGLSVNYLLGKLEDKENRLNIVMLDACRNTLGKGASSALSGDSAEGVFIAYATAEGKRARDNGLFASAFVKSANIAGLTIEEVFKKVRKKLKEETGQTPFTNSGIVGDFYFTLPIEKKENITVSHQVIKNTVDLKKIDKTYEEKKDIFNETKEDIINEAKPLSIPIEYKEKEKIDEVYKGSNSTSSSIEFVDVINVAFTIFLLTLI